MAQILRSLVGTIWSDGGQRVARRNAWAAMSADAKRARDRAEAMSYLTSVEGVDDGVPGMAATLTASHG